MRECYIGIQKQFDSSARYVNEKILKQLFLRVYFLIILCEQYTNLDKNVWESDSTGRTAFWDKAIVKGIKHQQAGFAGAMIGGIFVYSCYISPNVPLEDFT